jgi:hypothetical protein
VTERPKWFYVPVVNKNESYGGYADSEECLKTHGSAQLVCDHLFLDEVQDLKDVLESERKASEGLYAVLTHATELGYLGEGSTAGWVQEMLTNYEAVKYKR